jgi:hypothetical protein
MSFPPPAPNPIFGTVVDRDVDWIVFGPVLFVVALVAVANGHWADVWRAALGLAALEVIGFTTYVVLSALIERKELRPAA